MEKLNELAAGIKSGKLSASWVAVDSEHILAIAEAFRELEQRATNLNDGWLNAIAERDEARAKLAELAKSGRKISLEWVYEDELPEGYPYDEMFPFSKVDIVRMFPIFVTIPAPAADLAELVPDELTPKQASRSYGGEVVGYREGFNECRAEMLRKIEEAK
ncbi:hypothetical protein [Pantoea agglomerans]|uniref:hypothetical protein n=1 Tax=Enterobacter agglomerans TaxID=549 RepID=UPI003C7D2326